jgi:hypothetical protein
MALNFILILIYQACMNGDNKYHTLWLNKIKSK